MRKNKKEATLLQKFGTVVNKPQFDRTLFAACYVGFLALSILVGLFHFCEDRLLRATGKLEEVVYTTADFELVNLNYVNVEEDMLISINSDPRMVMMLDTPLRVSRVDIYISFATKPGEFNIFYMQNKNMEEFDPNYRVWAKEEAEDHYSFTLPRKSFYGLRIDPGIYGGNEMQFYKIVFNQKVSFFTYFAPSYTWAFYFVIAPALVACALKFIIAWVQKNP